MVDLAYQANVEPEPLPGRPNPRFPDEVSPASFGGSIGRGIEDAGAVLQNVHDKVQAQARQTQLADAHNQAQALSLKLTHDPDTGAFTKEGKDAFGLTQQYLPQFDQGIAAIAAQIPDPKARLAFTTSVAPSMRNEMTQQLDTHELNQHKQFAVKTAQASVSIAQQAAAANYNNPGIIASNRDTVDYSLQNLAKQQGWSDDQLTEATHHAHVQLNEGVLTSMLADKKVDMAASYLETVKSELTPAEYERGKLAVQKGQSDQVANSVVSVFRTAGPVAGGKALQAVESLKVDDDTKNLIRSNIERGLNQWHQEAQATHGDAIMGLEAKLASGQATAADVGQVYALHNVGAFTAEQTGSMVGRIQKSVLDKIPDTTYRDYVAGAVARGQALDPMDKDLRKGMDAAFQDATQGLPPGSAGWINRGADMARRTGIVPDSMIGWARTQIVSGDPARASAGAQTISRLMDADPRGLPYAMKDDKETASMAKMINDAVTAGADPTIAVETARTIINMPDAQKKALEDSYKKNKVAASALPSLVSLFSSQAPYKPGFMQAIPPIPPAMLGQYEELRQDYYKTTGGNVQQANQLAQANLKNVWGISEVNGKREFMMYAPESQNVGLTTKAVQDAMQDFAKGHTDDPTKVHLTPSVETSTTNGQQWNVSVPDKFGAYGPLLDARNNPLVFTLPTATQGLKSKATAQILERMESELNQQKLDNEGNAWLHEGMLKDALEQNRIKNANPVGEEFNQGMRGGH